MCSILSISFEIGSRPGKKVVSSSDSQLSAPSKANYKPYFQQEFLKCQISYSDAHMKELIQNRSKLNSISMSDSWRVPKSDPRYIEEAYEHCRRICSASSGSYYLGSFLMTKEQRKALWALYAWCRSTDDIVDGPNKEINNVDDILDSWEERLQDIFKGKPHSIEDVALTDAIDKFSMDIKPFEDMIEGMRMDTRKHRYENFLELYQFCYCVATTVAIMAVPVLGFPPESHASVQQIYDSALYTGIAHQLTNILRDVGEDSLRGRIYLPLDELAHFGLSERDVLSRKVSDSWREFMKFQIERARFYYNIAEEGVSFHHKANRGTLQAVHLLYQKILDEIENNDYDNLTKRASVGSAKKLLLLPLAYSKGFFSS